jgi:hypothetical protein
VVFAKLSDSELATAKKNRLLVRREVTDALLKIYRDNIDLYSQVSDNNDAIFGDNSEVILEDSCTVEDNDSNIMRDTDERFDRPGRDRPQNDAQVSTLSAYMNDTTDTTVLVTRSSNLMTWHNSRDHDLCAFPHLHSNGLGTLNDSERAVHVPTSVGRRHQLRIGLRIFAQDPLYMLVNFSNWNKDLSQGMMTVRLKRDGGLAHAACNVTREEMDALIEHDGATKAAILSGGSVPQLPDVLRNASRVMSNLKMAHKTMHGSEAQREDMRRTLYAASYQLGMPHFMITLTPSNVSNGMAVTIAKSGKVLFDLDDLETQQRTARIQELVSKDPAACAQYFWEITLFFFRDILGCDLEKRTTSDGLFGNIEWIGGGIETQGSQMLHFHVVGRSQRWPSRIEDLRDDGDEDIDSTDDVGMHLSDDEPADAPFDVHDEYADGNQDPDSLNADQKTFLTDTISRATLPIFEFFVDPESNHCVMCPSCTQPLEEVELSIFHQSNRVEQEAYVATCKNPNCRAEHFTPSRLRNACVEKACNLLGSEFNPHADVAAISISPSEPLEAPADDYDGCPAIRELLLDHIRNPDQPPPELEPSMAKYIRDVVRFTVALASFQEHRYLHCTSCFKKGKKKGMSATICRYGMPRKLRHVTIVNADGVELRRLNGNEFINGYSSLITMLTHSNHDLRFTFGPEAD